MSRPEFLELFGAPFLEHVAILEKEDLDLRTRLDTIHPDVLYKKLAAGAYQAQAAYAGVLSSETAGLIRDCLARAQAECARMRPVWDELDDHERHGVWEA